MTQLGLPIPGSVPKPAAAKPQRLTWSSYSGPSKCDHCLAALAHKTGLASRARHKLVDSTGRTWLLCGAHRFELEERMR